MLDAPLCQACHRTMTYEMNTPTMPFITEPSTPPNYSSNAAPTGPCFFGHTTSSAVHCQSSGAKKGQPPWFRIQGDMQGGDVTSNDTLCQGCYQKYRKAASIPPHMAKPAPPDTQPRTLDPSPAPLLAPGGPRCGRNAIVSANLSQTTAASFPLVCVPSVAVSTVEIVRDGSMQCGLARASDDVSVELSQASAESFRLFVC